MKWQCDEIRFLNATRFNEVHGIQRILTKKKPSPELREQRWKPKERVIIEFEIICESNKSTSHAVITICIPLVILWNRRL